MPNVKGELLEADVRDPSVKYANKFKSLVRHKRMHFGYGAAGGWPDDLFFFSITGHHWWVEFKRPGGTATGLQAKVHEQMREFGLDVSVIDDTVRFEQELRSRIMMHPTPPLVYPR